MKNLSAAAEYVLNRKQDDKSRRINRLQTITKNRDSLLDYNLKNIYYS